MEVGQSFSTDVAFSRTFADVKRLEVYILAADDNDDAGFAELALARAAPPTARTAAAAAAAAAAADPGVAPPPPPVAVTTPGLLTGELQTAAWSGLLGGDAGRTRRHTTRFADATECALFCGAVVADAAFSYYTEPLETLPTALPVHVL